MFYVGFFGVTSQEAKIVLTSLGTSAPCLEVFSTCWLLWRSCIGSLKSSSLNLSSESLSGSCQCLARATSGNKDGAVSNNILRGNIMNKRFRLIAYSILIPALIIMSRLFPSPAAGDELSIGSICTLIVIVSFVCLFIFDVVFFAVQGKSQPCIHCGHERKMKAFRVYGACPNCNQ